MGKVYKNKIWEYLSLAQDDLDIPDLREASPSLFSACMRWIYNELIKPNKKELILKDPNNGQVNNMYNYGILNYLCDQYMDICLSNDKVITIYDFEYLTGIQDETIYQLRDRNDIIKPLTYYYDPIYINNILNNTELDYTYNGYYNIFTVDVWREYLTSKPMEIYKKLHGNYQNALTGRLNGGKGNPIGTIAQLNHHFGWNDNAGGQTVKVIVQRSPDEIAASYGQIIEEKPQNKALPGNSAQQQPDTMPDILPPM